MTKPYTHKRNSSGSAKHAAAVQGVELRTRRGTWRWGAAFTAVTVAGLLLGSTAWTAANALSGTAADPRDVQAAVETPLVRGQSQSTASEERSPASVATAEAAETAETAAPATVWREDFSAALEAAGEQRMPVLLRFTASWCTPCRVMEAQVWPQEEVRRALAEHAIPVKIDINQESQAEVARRYGVRAIPALVLVDAEGEELARGGFMSAEELQEFLREAGSLTPQ